MTFGAAGPHEVGGPPGGTVSRETSPPPPPALPAGVIASALPRLGDYAALLAADGVRRGLIGPREVPRLWERHLLNCAVIEPAVPLAARVVDIGSGAGLPGLVLALVRPDLHVVLVDGLHRRAEFLSEALRALDVPNGEVVRGRAEELASLDGDVVTSRAVAPLARLAGWSLRHVRPAGTVLALKGAGAAAELASASATLRRLGVTDAQVLTFGADVLAEPTTVIRLTATGAGAVRARSERRRSSSARRRGGGQPTG